eukprot:TRINITY_DN32346_c0_g1_i1.p1 TRINITY_DN32346_c0_g1~~TRINITY_DN32346_c0_g1_i1.p1  ORF type:complete len:1368 (-),score=317.52 TRINITY_DN32346_c0_g1_i1:154-4257(-)
MSLGLVVGSQASVAEVMMGLTLADGGIEDCSFMSDQQLAELCGRLDCRRQWMASLLLELQTENSKLVLHQATVSDRIAQAEAAHRRLLEAGVAEPTTAGDLDPMMDADVSCVSAWNQEAAAADAAHVARVAAASADAAPAMTESVQQDSEVQGPTAQASAAANEELPLPEDVLLRRSEDGEVTLSWFYDEDVLAQLADSQNAMSRLFFEVRQQSEALNGRLRTRVHTCDAKLPAAGEDVSEQVLRVPGCNAGKSYTFCLRACAEMHSAQDGMLSSPWSKPCTIAVPAAAAADAAHDQASTAAPTPAGTATPVGATTPITPAKFPAALSAPGAADVPLPAVLHSASETTPSRSLGAASGSADPHQCMVRQRNALASALAWRNAASSGAAQQSNEESIRAAVLHPESPLVNCPPGENIDEGYSSRAIDVLRDLAQKMTTTTSLPTVPRGLAGRHPPEQDKTADGLTVSSSGVSEMHEVPLRQAAAAAPGAYALHDEVQVWDGVRSWVNARIVGVYPDRYMVQHSSLTKEGNKIMKPIHVDELSRLLRPVQAATPGTSGYRSPRLSGATPRVQKDKPIGSPNSTGMRITPVERNWRSPPGSPKASVPSFRPGGSVALNASPRSVGRQTRSLQAPVSPSPVGGGRVLPGKLASEKLPEGGDEMPRPDVGSFTALAQSGNFEPAPEPQIGHHSARSPKAFSAQAGARPKFFPVGRSPSRVSSPPASSRLSFGRARTPSPGPVSVSARTAQQLSGRQAFVAEATTEPTTPLRTATAATAPPAAASVLLSATAPAGSAGQSLRRQPTPLQSRRVSTTTTSVTTAPAASASASAAVLSKTTAALLSYIPKRSLSVAVPVDPSPSPTQREMRQQTQPPVILRDRAKTDDWLPRSPQAPVLSAVPEPSFGQQRSVVVHHSSHVARPMLAAEAGSVQQPLATGARTLPATPLPLSPPHPAPLLTQTQVQPPPSAPAGQQRVIPKQSLAKAAPLLAQTTQVQLQQQQPPPATAVRAGSQQAQPRLVGQRQRSPPPSKPVFLQAQAPPPPAKAVALTAPPQQQSPPQPKPSLVQTQAPAPLSAKSVAILRPQQSPPQAAPVQAGPPGQPHSAKLWSAVPPAAAQAMPSTVPQPLPQHAVQQVALGAARVHPHQAVVQAQQATTPAMSRQLTPVRFRGAEMQVVSPSASSGGGANSKFTFSKMTFGEEMRGANPGLQVPTRNVAEALRPKAFAPAPRGLSSMESYSHDTVAPPPPRASPAFEGLLHKAPNRGLELESFSAGPARSAPAHLLQTQRQGRLSGGFSPPMAAPVAKQFVLRLRVAEQRWERLTFASNADHSRIAGTFLAQLGLKPTLLGGLVAHMRRMIAQDLSTSTADVIDLV